MDISYHLEQIAVVGNEDRLITASKKGPVVFMASIVPLGIYAVQVPHASGNFAFEGLDKEMIMIGHQTKSGDACLPHF